MDACHHAGAGGVMRFSPAERFLTLSHVIDELPVDAGGELVRLISSAMFAVVRNMRGTSTEAEARFAIDRARDALLDASRINRQTRGAHGG